MKQTSLIAYKKYKEQSFNKQEKAIMSVLKCFPDGLTRQEIESYVNFKINAVCGRVRSLLDKDVIYVDGTRLNQETNVQNEVLKCRS